MKRILWGALLACLLMATPVLAADVVTQTIDCYGNPANMCIWTVNWTDDGADGISVRMGKDSRNNSNIFQQIKGFYAYPIITDPGTPAPTDNYDATLDDDFGVDLAGGLLANRHTTTSQRIVPKIDTTNSIYGGAPILTPVTFVIVGTSQDVEDAAGQLIVCFWRN